MARRALITAPRCIEWDEYQLPAQPEKGHVRLRARLSAISAGTELHLFQGVPMPPGVWEGFADLERAGSVAVPNSYKVAPSTQTTGPIYPVAIGYNCVADVIDVGTDVRDVAKGDRVFVLGRHQDVMDVPAWQAHLVPECVGDRDAVFSYIATLGLHALRRAEFQPGEHLGILGLGVVGIWAAAMATACGSRPICFEVNARRRAAAARAIPTLRILDPAAPDFPAGLQEILGPWGLDVVIEAGGSRAALDLALSVVDHQGRVVVAALHSSDLGPVLAGDFYVKECQIIATTNDPYEDPSRRHSRFTIGGNVRFVLDLMADGRLTLPQLQTRTFTADAMHEAYRLLESRDLAVLALVDWQRREPLGNG